MLPSGYMIEEDEALFIKKMQAAKSPSAQLLDSSIAVAKNVAAQIIAFAKDDAVQQAECFKKIYAGKRRWISGILHRRHT